MVLPSMAVAIAIFAPAEIWADNDERWEKLSKWQTVKEDIIPVLIIRDSVVDQNHVNIVEDVINSKEVKKNGRPLYSGWNEGIKEASKAFDVKIPTLEIRHTLDKSESIVIYLMGKGNKDGFDGYTNLYYNGDKEIEKAIISIYNADELNKKQIESIVRHELGHALGLSHTTAKEDLMRPTIDMNHSLISLLDLVALAHMY
ncbi:MAG: matrixin family metalloprotease [Nitrosopumilus sp.]